MLHAPFPRRARSRTLLWQWLGLLLLLIGTAFTPTSRSLAAAPHQQADLAALYRLDSSFGQNGVRRSDQTLVTNTPATRVTSDTVLLATPQQDQIVVQRFRADGSRDPLFGTNGSARATVGATVMATAVVTQTTGAIVVLGTTGYVSHAPGYPFTTMLVRFTANGQLDASFGTNGVVTLPAAVGVAAMAVQNDDALVLVGSAAATSPNRLWAARYTAAGVPDPTFGSGGTRTFAQAGGFARVQLQPDGTIVAVGIQTGCGAFACSSTLLLARLQADGTGDPAFGTDGVVTDGNWSAETQLNAPQFVTVDAQGHIVLGLRVGLVSTASRATCWLLGYTASGTRDASFGTAAVVSVPSVSATDSVSCVFGSLPDGQYAVVRRNMPPDGAHMITTAVFRLAVSGAISAAGGVTGEGLELAQAVVAGPDAALTLTGINVFGTGTADGNAAQVVQARLVAVPVASTVALPIIQQR